MQRTVGTVLVAVLVVLAGCSGVLGGSDEPTQTLTPAAVPTDEPTPTPVPQLAPGLTGAGVESPSALVAAHESFLRNRSFTVRWNSTAVAPNGSVLSRGARMIYVGPPGEGFRIPPARNDSGDNLSSETGPVSTELWSGGERVLLKQTYANGTTTYDRIGTDAEQFRDPLEQRGVYLYESLGTANTTVTERLTRNGRTLYRVRGTTRTEEWENVSMELLVDSRGVIHESRAVREITVTENSSKIDTKTRFVAINETDAPERPSWVDEAVNRTRPAASGRTETSEETDR